jgi:hypothetical protein
MTTKQRQINIEQPSLLEKEIVRIVDKAMKDSHVQLAAEDVRVIAQDIMPGLDQLIAEKVKIHFLAIGQFLIEKFSMGD